MANRTATPSLARFVQSIQKKKMAELWGNKADEIWESV